MTVEQYVELVRSRLAANFEIEAPAVEDGEQFLLIARYHEVSGRIFITKKDIIDKYETFEACYMKQIIKPEVADIEDYFRRMCRKAENLSPGKDHFYTDITGIIVSESLPSGIERLVKKMKYEKTFRLLWRGFAKVRIVCIDLKRKEVYTNKEAKKIKKVYQW